MIHDGHPFCLNESILSSAILQKNGESQNLMVLLIHETRKGLEFQENQCLIRECSKWTLKEKILISRLDPVLYPFYYPSYYPHTIPLSNQPFSRGLSDDNFVTTRSCKHDFFVCHVIFGSMLHPLFSPLYDSFLKSHCYHFFKLNAEDVQKSTLIHPFLCMPYDFKMEISYSEYLGLAAAAAHPWNHLFPLG